MLKRYAKDENIFECLNSSTLRPIDGHDLPLVIATLKERLKRWKDQNFTLISYESKGLQKAEEIK